ncbi:hypothetical protein EVAR_12855_1 [Eumeta japonica]|uniref:Histone-lysine N-methyltransferase SETMAR n=1 Tax=Eumeta variegata TaxID=151549 RepID=A0A4C1TVN8_EUMVA|nr:hypothetical protein EVAR_12855_1 [Eumeta japonica]
MSGFGRPLFVRGVTRQESVNHRQMRSQNLQSKRPRARPTRLCLDYLKTRGVSSIVLSNIALNQLEFSHFASNFDGKDETRFGRPVTDNVGAILEKVEQGQAIGSYNMLKELEIDHKTVSTDLKKPDIQESTILECRSSLLKEIY